MRFIVSVLCAVFLLGCGERDDLIRRKLDVILASDLKTITADIPMSGLMQTPYYSLVFYKTYTEGMYSKMAVADFYFLKTVKAKITRKYRYLSEARLWDRYYNEYTFFDDTAHHASW